MLLICCNNTVNVGESCIILIDSTLDFCAILWHNERMQKEAYPLPVNSMPQSVGLRVYLLGPLRIERDGVAFSLSRRKVEALLAYLLRHPEPQTRDYLATLFWGDSSDAQARHSLRTALATVRKEVAADLLLADRDQVQLNPDFACWVDLHTLLAVEQELDTIAIDLLLAKVALWQGDLLTGFYEDWIVLEREHYRERLLKLCLQATQTLRARSEYTQAIAVAQRVLTLDPANEHAHQHLMFCYMAAGDRPAALRQYELCERLLEEELDVPPQPETTALYHWIRQQSSEAAATAARITNLPIPLTSFVGRTDATAAVKRLLTPIGGKTRLLTLTGAGGSGKTRLAIQVATDLIDRFADGVWWVELAALTEGEQVARAVAKALGVTERPQEPAVQSVVNFLGEKQLLLVIDNCEHVIAASAQLAVELLSRCPHLQILTTSREALNVAGEMIWQVPTLGLPIPQQVVLTDLLLQFECIRLFVERASAVQPGFHLTLENAPAVVNICTQLDGIPLAIELAAACTDSLTLDEIATHLNDRFRLLAWNQQAALPRHQTLRAAIEWSDNLLSTTERALLYRLAVFAGSWTVEAAVAICGPGVGKQGVTVPEVGRLLLRLVDKSLVTIHEQNGSLRYHLSETIRQYALEKGQEQDKTDTLSDRHLAYFLTWTETNIRKLQGSEQALWLERIEQEHANLRATLRWAMESHEVEAALRLSAALWRFWYARGYLQEGRSWLEQALAIEYKDPKSKIAVQADALNGAGGVAYAQGDYASAQRFYAASLDLREQTEDAAGIAIALNNLGLVARNLGDYARASALLEQSITQCRALGDAIGIAYALTSLGEVARLQGDIPRAVMFYEESLLRWQELDNQGGMATALHNLGYMALRQQNTRLALKHFRAGLTIFQQHGNQRGLALCLAGLAGAAGQMGQPERAARLFGAEHTLHETIGASLEPADRADRDQHITFVRSQLDAPTFQINWNEGTLMKVEQAVSYANSDA